MPRAPRGLPPAAGEPIVVVYAADDEYVVPLAAAVRSLCEHMPRNRELRLFVLDGGIHPRRRKRLLDSWSLPRGAVTWVDGLAARVRHLPVWKRFGLACYFRLLIADVLPPDCERAIYLDSDVLVLDDIAGLWSTDLRGKALGAVQDAALPLVRDAIPTAATLGLSPRAKYFNSGVLVMDLARWRGESLGAQVIEFVNRHADSIRFPDQDALNAVLGRKWRPLERRWNVFLDAFGPEAPEGETTEPGILHLVGTAKPWSPECTHPRRDLFFDFLDRTSWAGWRPGPAVRVRPRPPPSC